jgi:hypothetical protein
MLIPTHAQSRGPLALSGPGGLAVLEVVSDWGWVGVTADRYCDRMVMLGGT